MERSSRTPKQSFDWIGLKPNEKMEKELRPEFKKELLKIMKGKHYTREELDKIIEEGKFPE